jgi:hypothetical protein
MVVNFEIRVSDWSVFALTIVNFNVYVFIQPAPEHRFMYFRTDIGNVRDGSDYCNYSGL